MRKITALCMLVAMIGIAACGTLNKNPMKPVQLTINLNDSRSVAEGLFNKTISDLQVVQVLAMPVEYNLGVAKQVMILRGYTDEQAQDFVYGLRSEIGQNQARAVGPLTVFGACSQSVEHKTVVRDPVWAYTYTTFTDPTRGQEWLYYFSPRWTVNSNNIRWGANDPLVFWGLYLAYGSISGSNLCGNPHRLLIGNKGMALAGGPDLVLARLYLHHT